MDDITYTALGIALKVGKTNRDKLPSLVKDKFTPSEYNNIDRIVSDLFKYNYFESFMIGNMVPPNPLDAMLLTKNATDIFIEEKTKRDKQNQRNDLDDKVKKITLKNYTSSFIFAMLTTAFIGISAYFQATDKISTRLQELNSQEQQTLQTLDSIRQYEKGIRSSLEIIAKDTSWHASIQRHK